MKCPRCFKTCNKIEVQAWNRCGRCEARDLLANGIAPMRWGVVE